MTDEIEEHNKRILQAVSYLIEWAKHVITISAALLVLSATIVKDLAKDANPPISYLLASCLVLFCLSTLVGVLFALRLVRHAASTVLTTEPQIGSGSELANLQQRLHRTQRAFLASLTLFSAVVLSVVLTWALGLSHTTSQPGAGATTTPQPVAAQPAPLPRAPSPSPQSPKHPASPTP